MENEKYTFWRKEYFFAKEKEDDDMRRREEEYKQNNFNGNVNFTGGNLKLQQEILSIISRKRSKKRQIMIQNQNGVVHLLLAVLTWISTIIAIVGIFPFAKIVKSAVRFFRGMNGNTISLDMQKYSIIFIIFVFLFLIFFTLRRIAKKQTRHPLFFNFAISGYGNRLTIEKIHIEGCPQCGGKMKYYNKPVEWREILRSDGSTKREVTKRIPVLECKRNAEHWYAVDPAEDRVK